LWYSVIVITSLEEDLYQHEYGNEAAA